MELQYSSVRHESAPNDKWNVEKIRKIRFIENCMQILIGLKLKICVFQNIFCVWSCEKQKVSKPKTIIASNINSKWMDASELRIQFNFHFHLIRID